MNISAWAIKRPIPIILLFLILTLVGLMAYRGLGVDDDPDVDFPIIVISVGQAGASPAELESEITRKVEDSLVGVAGLNHIVSTLSEGASVTIAEFKVGSSSETALNDVRDAVSKIRQTLPQDVEEPRITHPTGAGEPFMTYTIASPTRSVADLSRLVDEDVSRALLAVPGVAQVTRTGGLKREIRVTLDPGRLRALGATVDQVGLALKGLNLNLPGGRAEAGGQEQAIRTLGSAATVEDLRAVQVGLPGGQSARLDTLGTVEDTHAEVREKAFLDGQPVVAFSVVRAKGASLVQTEEAARKEITALSKVLPADVKLELVRTMADYTRRTFKSTMEALIIGSVLAVIVIFAFLRNWQSTVISALAIPLSLIATFAVMKWLGYTLNGITMLGLTLVVGVLVDDAIVDLENIYRHIGLGKHPFRAALEATDEIGLAIVATTATIVAVFIPVAFMSGITGMFFRSFGLTVTASVLFSLLVARTLTPMMAAYMLPAQQETTAAHAPPRYLTVYQRILTIALDHRWITMALAVAVFIGSAMLVPSIPKGFIDNGDIGQARIDVTLPPGSLLGQTEDTARAVEATLRDRPEIARIFTTVGGDSIATGHLNVILKPRHERSLTLDQFEEAMRPALARIPGARIEFRHFGVGGSSKPVNVLLRSADSAQLTQVGGQLLADMRGVKGLREVTSTAAQLRPEIQIRPDFARAAEQGVSVAQIGRLARLATQGDVEFNLPKFNAGNQQVNIRVQLADSAREDLERLGDLLVPGRAGLVPLRTVAALTFGTGPVQIDRRDRARQVTFTANLDGVSLGEAMERVQALPIMHALPAGVSQGTVGESEIMAEVFGQFAIALGTAVLFIYAVLVLLFGGFLQPLTIMLALPLSIGGALVGLMLTGKMLGLMALIGIVMLMGLVTKNSILLVEYAIMARAQGLGRREALMQAGRDRLRPILMTTIAMIAGMLPIALALGEGTEGLSPMAVAVIGGLITSTVLTLVVIPAAYTLIDDFQGLLRRLTGRPAAPATAGTHEVLIGEGEATDVLRR